MTTGWPRLLLTFTAAALIYLAYQPGVTGALYYDDYANLEGLANIASLGDAIRFVTSGFAGPLGRPIALASFLPHADGWPDNGVEILRTNTLIHIANGLLLGLLGYLILCLRDPGNRNRTFWIAFSAALLWASLPLLASTSLIAIQRMTSLAATFGLLGLIGFVAGLLLQAQRPRTALTLQLGALGTGTFLAILSKENGALILVFALLIDTLLLRDLADGNPTLVRWRRRLLGLGLAAILFYISPLKQDWFTVIDFRGFSPWERLQTEVVILWEYLRLAFLPLPSAFGPFHDHRGIDYAEWTSAQATGAWLIVIGTGLWLRSSHRRMVWPLFAVLWFFTGHLLESTTIGLEIYFEHRNYLAVYGICLALSAAAFSATGNLKRVAPALLGLFIALQLGVLASVTSIWGRPLVAAEMWTSLHPASGRAVIHQVFLEAGAISQNTAGLNFQFIDRQRRGLALERLDRTAAACPECLEVRLEALRHSCDLTSESDTEQRLREAIAAAQRGKGARATLDLLFRLRDIVNDDRCPPLNSKGLLDVVDNLLENALFALPIYHVRALFIAAALQEDMGNDEARDSHLARAETIEPRALPVLQYQVYSALAEHDYARAMAAIERRRPVTRLVGVMSDAVLDGLARVVDEARYGGMEEQKDM
jgi:hypothetical protein